MTNSASLCNVYWQVNGQVDLGPGSTFLGTIVVNGAINLLAEATLHSRGLSSAGAISMYNNTVTLASCAAAPSPIPILSEWALIVLGIFLLGVGVVYILRRRQSPLGV